ncbi:MAG: M23 family metallopeptidase [Candidatus Aminicenantes bacterium]|nr:M23 family metallopeptidase [Candidatus Aminicenantes bacterium]
MLQKKEKILTLLIVFFLAGLFLIRGETKKQPLQYRWPLDINNGYSSAFQEFSYNHFHGGIDLRTHQKTGYPVRALADGSIYKIRVVKRGSGRGLYLKHDDGNTSIYFHLEKFAPKLESILRQVQKAKNTKYFGNYFLKNPVLFKEGEIIAYSGETGSGYPHLHLEIRDREYYAINPFPLLKFPKRDANFPVLKGVVVRNRGDSLINGRVGEFFFKFLKKGRHVFTVKEPLLISGEFETVLNLYDISDTGKYVAPYEVSAYIDDERYFHLSFDRFNRGDNNQLGFVYDMFRTKSTSFFFNLFFQEGFELEGEKRILNDLNERIPPGEHLLKIQVKDNHNNLSTGLVPFYKVRQPVIKVTGIQKTAAGISFDIEELQAEDAEKIEIKLLDGDKKNLYTGVLKHRRISEKLPLLLKGVSGAIVYMDFLFSRKGAAASPYNKSGSDQRLYFKKRYLLSFGRLDKITAVSFETFINRDEIFILVKDPRISSQNMRLQVIQGGNSADITAQHSSDLLFFRFRPLNFANDMTLRFKIFAGEQLLSEVQEKIKIIHLKEGHKQDFEYGDFRASFAPRSVYEPKVLKAVEKNFPSAYPVLSQQVSLAPYHFPFLDTVYYKFKKKVDNPKQAGIFKYSFARKAWYSVYTTYDSASFTFKSRLISSGTFALLRDVFQPTISFIRPRTKYLSKVGLLVVRIKDKGKGVNDNTLKITINGRRIECEYDPDRDHVKLEDLRALKKGENKIFIGIEDYAGNYSSKTYRFYLN